MSGSKIGLIFPAGGRKSPEEEIGRYLPEDMALISHQIRFDQISPQGLTEMGERVEGAAVELAKQGVGLVLFCCTSGSFIGGIGYDARLMERMEAATGLPALTTSTAVVAALRALEIRRLSMGTPYPDPVNEAEIDFLARSGVRVVKAKGLGIERPPLVSQTPPERLIQLAEEIVCPEAQAIFLSCTGLIVMDLIPRLERLHHRPVITSNQATLWMALKRLGAEAKRPPGRLFDR